MLPSGFRNLSCKVFNCIIISLIILLERILKTHSHLCNFGKHALHFFPLFYYCDIEPHCFSVCFQYSNFTTFVDNSVFQFHRTCFELQSCFGSSSWSILKSFDDLIRKQSGHALYFLGANVYLYFITVILPLIYSSLFLVI